MNRRAKNWLAQWEPKDWLIFGACVLIFGHWSYFTVYQPYQAYQQARRDATKRPDRGDWNTSKKPTSNYKAKTIVGFNVLIDQQIRDHATQRQTEKNLKRLLTEVARVVEPQHLAELQKVKIWLSAEPLLSNTDNRTDRAAGWYIPATALALQTSGKNPDKAQGIEIGDIATFNQYDADTQFEIVLHELAHAYHDRVLGDDYAPIIATYKHAMARRLYHRVPYSVGGQGVAYATTDPDEYFAELSLTYLAHNETFPYNRRDLVRYDPKGYDLVEKIWHTAR
jgi:hypothetical protein